MHRSKSGNNFLIDLLDSTLNLVAMGVGSSEGSTGTRESDGNSERLVDGFSIRTEGLNSMPFRVVEANESTQAINYIIVILGFRSKDGKKSTEVINENDGLCITTM